MRRTVLSLAIGGGAGAATNADAVSAALSREWASAMNAADGPTAAVAVLAALPIMVILFRAWIGFMVATLFIAGGSALAARLYFVEKLPPEHVLVATGVYGVGALAAYHLLVRRVIG